METNRLRQFRVIVETGHLRQSADLLGISHSGLSKSMKLLELELGYKIFHPSGRGLVITDRGQQLYNDSGPLLKELDRILKAHDNDQNSVVRLGSFEVFTSYFMGPLLKKYLPKSDIEVHELIPGRLEEALDFNRIDIGITYEPQPRKGIEYMPITSILMGAYVLKGHFKNQELSQIPFVVPVSPLEGTPSGIKGRDGWPDEKWERNIHFRVDLMSTGLEIVHQGLGAIFVPRFVADLHNRVVNDSHKIELIHTVPKSLTHIKRNVYIVKRESTPETHEVRQIAKALRNICGHSE